MELNHISAYQNYCFLLKFDHIIPRSRGGTNDIDNLGICTKAANQAKNDMTPDEFFNLCKVILEHNGYQVSK